MSLADSQVVIFVGYLYKICTTLWLNINELIQTIYIYIYIYTCRRVCFYLFVRLCLFICVCSFVFVLCVCSFVFARLCLFVCVCSFVFVRLCMWARVCACSRQQLTLLKLNTTDKQQNKARS